MAKNIKPNEPATKADKPAKDDEKREDSRKTNRHLLRRPR